ncbi:hypothetical protein F5879DRAFT_979547 [Lentinula edodes]|nr:hypothetical protein F5879DRAFT_979547 [Lentinula edodes]
MCFFCACSSVLLVVLCCFLLFLWFFGFLGLFWAVLWGYQGHQGSTHISTPQHSMILQLSKGVYIIYFTRISTYTLSILYFSLFLLYYPSGTLC